MSGSCTLLPGESVSFTLVGGDGGPGGAGGAGGNGGAGWDGAVPVVGGWGGVGGVGGVGGDGSRLTGSYTNSGEKTVTVTVVVGEHGLAGAAGVNGADGLAVAAAAASGYPGQDGTDGLPGTAGLPGGDSVLLVGETVIAAAGGGQAGTGGMGGSGGKGGGADGTPGADGDAGLDGFAGLDGVYFPLVLPEGWVADNPGREVPSAVFSAASPDPAVTTTGDVRDTDVLPDAGLKQTFSMFAAMFVAAGAALLAVSRRRTV